MSSQPWEHKTPSTCPRVVIAWRDIRDVSSWDDDEEIRCARNLQTTGWLVYEGPDEGEPDSEIVVIAKTYDFEEGKWADFTIFPRIVVKRVLQ
jgi:hypothetical protein